MTSRSTPFDPEPWRLELRAFLVRLGAKADADDIVQETFLRSIRRPPQGAPRPWLYGIALNLLRDQKRKEKRAGAWAADKVVRERSEQGERTGRDDPHDRAEAGDLLARAARVIGSLSDRQRAALELRMLHHKDYDAVGRTLGCTAATARQHVYLALKAVRDAMNGDAP